MNVQSFWESARVPRAGERVIAIADFVPVHFHSQLLAKFGAKTVSARRRNQHARRVRYPE